MFEKSTGCRHGSETAADFIHKPCYIDVPQKLESCKHVPAHVGRHGEVRERVIRRNDLQSIEI